MTRARADGEAFAAALTARFGGKVRPVVAPLIAPRFLTPVIPDRDYAAVVFTSAQAVEAARRLGISLPSLAWCVGRKTAAAASASGFHARSADGDAKTLADAILKNPPDGRILYLHGVDIRGNLLEKLEFAGIDIDVAIVYAQEPRPLAAEALALVTTPHDLIVPLFSPRSADLFRAALPPDTAARLHLAAMSTAVADALAGLPRAALAIARHPDAPAMLEAVESLLAALPAP
ncbi:uroporphyrinogen-III synthase [Tabrizicola sp.]|uniref:uroporphyrinogen-III synthase n=1 Tax=Tabrizicola sp. TaxID=2005166 RepID=UPI001A5E2C25|nr:uroporphyrinogen-III synthase [Tabrizicola sp.]MBL9073703.1 uroporphyrinogen-III synthase [Tabrizicola sp.]